MPPHISCNIINWTINFAFITANNLIWNLYDDDADDADDGGIKLLARSRWITTKKWFSLYIHLSNFTRYHLPLCCLRFINYIHCCCYSHAVLFYLPFNCVLLLKTIIFFIAIWRQYYMQNRFFSIPLTPDPKSDGKISMPLWLTNAWYILSSVQHSYR